MDGYFGKRNFIAGVGAVGLEGIGKRRADANLRYLYAGPRRSGPGRPKRYHGKVTLADLSRFECLPVADEPILLYQAVVYHVHLKRTVRVVIVVNSRTQRRLVLFSTALTLPALTIYRSYKARFQVKFLFRDAKQFTGLTDCQARSPAKLHCHFNASLTALSLANLEAHAPGVPFSMASLKRRSFNQPRLDRIMEHLTDGASLEKCSPLDESLCNYGTIVEPAA